MPPIIKDNCSLCGTCTMICPLNLLNINKEKKILEFTGADCIECGHCEAICPTAAIEVMSPALQEDGGIAKTITIDPSTLGSYFKSRRSIRNFQQEKVPKEKIKQLLDITRYAPSGLNRQTIHWTVIYEPSQVQKLAEAVLHQFGKLVEINHPLSKAFDYSNLLQAWKHGKDTICRNAPHLVLAHVPKEDHGATFDGITALSHLELAAPAFGLGTCWAGFVSIIFGIAGDQLRSIMGLPEDHNLIGALMLGIPQYRYLRIPKRNPVKLTWA